MPAREAGLGLGQCPNADKSQTCITAHFVFYLHSYSVTPTVQDRSSPQALFRTFGSRFILPYFHRPSDIPPPLSRIYPQTIRALHHLAFDYRSLFRLRFPMSKNKTALEKLEAQRAQVDARIKALKARDRDQRRKDDTRRNILIGALAKKHLETFPDSEFAATLRTLLDQHVTRPPERELLGLPPRDNAKPDDPREPANESTPQVSAPYNAFARNRGDSSSS